MIRFTAMAKRRNRSSQQPERVRDGALCATFVNTAKGERKPLETYADLLEWGQVNDVLSATDVQRLALAASKRPDDTEKVARKALDLRECLERVFDALVTRQSADACDLELLNGSLGTALSARRLVPAASGYQLVWDDLDGDDLDRMLWPVLVSASDLLSSDDHRRFRQCAGTDCGIFFVDRSPGSPRKWCSTPCGHRVRSRRHYHAKVKPYWQRIARNTKARMAREREERRRREARASENSDD